MAPQCQIRPLCTIAQSTHIVSWNHALTQHDSELGLKYFPHPHAPTDSNLAGLPSIAPTFQSSCP